MGALLRSISLFIKEMNNCGVLLCPYNYTTKQPIALCDMHLCVSYITMWVEFENHLSPTYYIAGKNSITIF